MINVNSMTLEDIENLKDFYCADCCMSCDECNLSDFVSTLYYCIEDYNKITIKLQ